MVAFFPLGYFSPSHKTEKLGLLEVSGKMESTLDLVLNLKVSGVHFVLERVCLILARKKPGADTGFDISLKQERARLLLKTRLWHGEKSLSRAHEGSFLKSRH